MVVRHARNKSELIFGQPPFGCVTTLGGLHQALVVIAEMFGPRAFSNRIKIMIIYCFDSFNVSLKILLLKGLKIIRQHVRTICVASAILKTGDI